MHTSSFARPSTQAFSCPPSLLGDIEERSDPGTPESEPASVAAARTEPPWSLDSSPVKAADNESSGSLTFRYGPLFRSLAVLKSALGYPEDDAELQSRNDFLIEIRSISEDGVVQAMARGNKAYDSPAVKDLQFLKPGCQEVSTFCRSQNLAKCDGKAFLVLVVDSYEDNASRWASLTWRGATCVAMVVVVLCSCWQWPGLLPRGLQKLLPIAAKADQVGVAHSATESDATLPQSQLSAGKYILGGGILGVVLGVVLGGRLRKQSISSAVRRELRADETLRSKKTEFMATLNEKNEELRRLDRTHQDLIDEYHTLTENMGEAKKEADKRKSEFDELRDKYKVSERARYALEVDVHNSREASKRLEDEKTTAESHVKFLEDEKWRLSEENCTLEVDRQQLRRALEDKEAALRNAATALEASQKCVANAERDTRVVRMQMQTMQEEAKEREQRVKSLEQERYELQRQNSDSQMKATKHRTDAETRQRQVKDKSDEVEAQRSSIAAARAERDDAWLKQKDIETKLQDTKKDLASAEIKVDSLNSRVDLKDKEILKLKKDVRDRAAEADEHKKKSEMRRADLKFLRDQYSALVESKKALERDVENVKQDVGRRGNRSSILGSRNSIVATPSMR